MVRTKIEEEKLLEHKIIIVKITNPSFDRGITGLIANKIAAEYQRPVGLLVAGKHEGKLCWSGSARGYEKSDLTDFRQFVRDSNLAYLAEGHPNAFGLGIYDEDIDNFIAYADEALKNIDFILTYRVDNIYSQQTVNSKDIIDIGGMKSLWG